ncbi:MAG: hypothetical protein HC769_26005 [Cyanobacteria bacterium CRU_2_1]|nr:hypothetical protein [Cyanobacteria bacterium CRU_2_1]
MFLLNGTVALACAIAWIAVRVRGRVAFLLFAIAVDIHPGDRNSVPRTGDIARSNLLHLSAVLPLADRVVSGHLGKYLTAQLINH